MRCVLGEVGRGHLLSLHAYGKLPHLSNGRKSRAECRFYVLTQLFLCLSAKYAHCHSTVAG